MNLLVIGACYHSQEFYNNCYKYILRSSEKQGIPLQIYGMGAEHYPGWIEIKIRGKLDYLKTVSGEYTHVLYTDTSDAFFTGSLDEIVGKYKGYGSPKMLCSASVYKQGGNEDSGVPTKYKNLHNGGYIAEIHYLIHLLEKFLEISDSYGDDSHIWYKAEQEGWLTPLKDETCQIFQVIQTQYSDGDHISVKNGRLFNNLTNSYPCILHLADGYTDPVSGKNNLLSPWFDKIYGELL